MNYRYNFLPGDMVGIKDDGFIEVPEGYFYSGMILREKAPIHTFTYYVMLYPKNTITDNQIKIVEVPEEHLILERFINREHYDTGSTKYRVIHLLNKVLKTIRNIESTKETESLLKFMDGYVQGMIDYERKNLDDQFACLASRNCCKSYLSSTYGEVLNNGKTKQSN